MKKLIETTEKNKNVGKHTKKLLNILFSVKFQILVASCAFLYIGKLDQSNWVTVVLTVAGFRTINEVSGMYKSIKNAQNGVSKNDKK